MLPLEIAQKCAEIMWENDQASKGLGMKLEKVCPGKAEVSLVIEDKHLNGHGICHGGFIFTLADSAFAFACNTYNQSTVAQKSTTTGISEFLTSVSNVASVTATVAMKFS